MKSKAGIIHDICVKVENTLRAKDSDYGNSVAETRKKFPMATAIRLTDKIHRLQNYYLAGENKMKVKDETLKDTLLDIAGYAILELAEMEVDFQKIAEGTNDVCN